LSDIRDRLDDLERFVERTDGKVYPRRIFMGMCAMTGPGADRGQLSPALADAQELVLVNWGGDAIKGMKASFVDPYLKKYPDRKVAIDGTGPSTKPHPPDGREQEGRVDVMDRNLHTALEIGPEGMLEPMDYTIIDKSKVRPEHAVPWGIGNYIYAMVLTYKHQEVGAASCRPAEGRVGRQKVPRKRAFRREPDGACWKLR